MPRFRQSRIHSSSLPSSGDFATWNSEIIADYNSGNSEEIGNHVIREFNRKAYNFGYTGQMLAPYDAGFRFVGTSSDLA